MGKVLIVPKHRLNIQDVDEWSGKTKRKIKMRITLDFEYVEHVDGTCSPTRFCESHVHCRNGLEKYAAKIQEACVDVANKVLDEMKKEISNERK